MYAISPLISDVGNSVGHLYILKRRSVNVTHCVHADSGALRPKEQTLVIKNLILIIL